MILYVGNYLSRHGYTPTMCELLAPRLEEMYPLIRTSSRKNQAFRLLDMLTTLFINRKKIKWVLIDTYSYRAFWYASLIAQVARACRIPYFPVIRGGDFKTRIQKTEKKVLRYLKGASRVIVLSGFMEEILKPLHLQNTITIPSFIDIQKYPFRKREQIHLKLLWVRSFHTLYNPILALHVVKKLLAMNYDVQLLMVGPDKDGSMKEIQKLIDTDSLASHIRITGKLSKEEWIALSEDYDIFINTSNYDNYPFSVIEAMALGLPVISTNAGGVPYLIRDKYNGILVEKNDVQGFTDAVLVLKNDKELTQSICTHARNMTESLDWTLIKNKWKSLFDENI
jgi:glycosyltransferase involved in cell wall biosynthesis